MHAALAALERKYVILLRLRQEREALEARGVLRLAGDAAAQRRALAQAVAREFPGALRELEARDSGNLQLCRDQVAHERAFLLAHPRRRVPRQRWIRMSLAYHAALREGLAIRQWLAQHRHDAAPSQADLVRGFVSWYQQCAARQQPLERVDAAWLRRYATPPQGRLSTLVWEDLAALFRCAPRTVRRHVLGVS